MILKSLADSGVEWAESGVRDEEGTLGEKSSVSFASSLSKPGEGF